MANRRLRAQHACHDHHRRSSKPGALHLTSHRPGVLSRLSIPVPTKGIAMLYWAVVFFIIAIVAAVFGFTGIARDSAYIGKIIAVICIILAIISFIFSRRSARG